MAGLANHDWLFVYHDHVFDCGDAMLFLAASTVSLSNVMTPIIALVLGATLNHEHISAHAVAGIAVVMLGIVMYFWKDWQRQYFSKW